MKLKIAILVAITILLNGLAIWINSNPNADVLYVYNWTYYTPKDVVEAFEKEYNCKIILDEYASNEEMYNKIKNGASDYDIVVPSQDFVKIMISQDMFQPLDLDAISNKKYVNEAALEKAKESVGDEYVTYAMPYYFGAAGISVNITKVPKGSYKKDWSIFSDKQFAGHATMMDDMREVIGDALNYNNCDVNSVDKDELARAFGVIDQQWKPNLVKFDAEAFGKSFAEGDFWLCQGYAEVTHGEIPEDKWESTIDFFIPESGGPAYLDSLCILKNSKHADLANKFINYICDPENYAKFLDFFGFPCFVNTEATQYRNKDQKLMFDAEDEANMGKCTLKNDLGEDLYTYNQLWEQIRFGTD